MCDGYPIFATITGQEVPQKEVEQEKRGITPRKVWKAFVGLFSALPRGKGG